MGLRLISIDPGKRAGCAMFEAGRLAWSGGFDGDAPRLALPVPDALVIETPHTGAGKATTKDLITLSIRAGIARCLWGVTVPARFVVATDWKGSTPKTVHHPRILATLTSHELEIAEVGDPNVIDAIGLGLWTLGRLPR